MTCVLIPLAILAGYWAGLAYYVSPWVSYAALVVIQVTGCWAYDCVLRKGADLYRQAGRVQP